MAHYHPLETLNIVAWKDLIEIGILAFSIYRFTRWLKQDEYKNLTWYLYAWSGVTITSWLLELHTINAIAIYCWPAALVLLIIVHQKTIQRRFITHQQVIPAQRLNHEAWVSQLVRFAYLALHGHKELTFCIQGTQSLQDAIIEGVELHIPTQHNTLQLLITSSAVHHTSTIIIGVDGQLLYYNAKLQAPYTHETDQQKYLHDWHQYSINVTAHYDCVMVKLSPTTHQFDIAAQGTVVTGVMAEQAQATIIRYLKKLSLGHNVQGGFHGSQVEQASGPSNQQ